jgi:hypothetical protein
MVLSIHMQQGLLFCFKHSGSNFVIGGDEFHRENELYFMGKEGKYSTFPKRGNIGCVANFSFASNKGDRDQEDCD